MVSLYPQNLDSFRSYLEGFDYLCGLDLSELFDAAWQLQIEMGLEPSGDFGTVGARLFENGNLSQSSAGWNRLLWRGDQGVAQSSIFTHNPSISATGIGFRVTFQPERFAGKDTSFGEGVPTPFGALQGPVSSGVGANGRGAVPWRSCVSEAADDECAWIAVDGENEPINTTNTIPCRWGYILWNLIT